MSSKMNNIIIAGTKYDGRMKLSPEAKQAIKELYENGYSQRKLADMFHVSRWTVQNILVPKKRKKTTKRYSTEYWTEVKRKYRLKKKQIITSKRKKNA